MFTEELFELYKRYELAVHKKERTKSEFKRYFCGSPVFDPEVEPHKANSPMLLKGKFVDRLHNVYKDEGVYPLSLGTYFMYHRIDGKLVAFGVFDIT